MRVEDQIKEGWTRKLGRGLYDASKNMPGEPPSALHRLDVRRREAQPTSDAVAL